MTEKTYTKFKIFMCFAVFFGCAIYCNALKAQQYIPPEQIYKYAKEQNTTALRYAGYSIDSQNTRGDTAVCLALAEGNTQAYHTLLKYGANPNPRCASRYGSAQMSGTGAYSGRSGGFGLSPTGWLIGAAIVAGGVGIAVASGGGGSKGGSSHSSACSGYQTECPAGYIQSEDTCTSGDKTYYKCKINPCYGYATACTSGWHATGDQCRSGDTIMYKCAINECDGYQKECPTGYEWTGRTCQSGNTTILLQCAPAACEGYNLTSEPQNCEITQACPSGDEIKYKCRLCKTGWDGEDCNTPATCPEGFKTECDLNSEYIGAYTCPSGGKELPECLTRGNTSNCTAYEPNADKCTSCEDGYSVDENGYCISNAATCLLNGYETAPDCEITQEYTTPCPLDATYKKCTARENTVGCSDYVADADKCSDCTSDYVFDSESGSCFEKIGCVHGTQIKDQCQCHKYWSGEKCDVLSTLINNTEINVSDSGVDAYGMKDDNYLRLLNDTDGSIVMEDNTASVYGIYATGTPQEYLDQNIIAEAINKGDILLNNNTADVHGMYLPEGEIAHLTNAESGQITITGSGTTNSDTAAYGMNAYDGTAQNDGTISMNSNQESHGIDSTNGNIINNGTIAMNNNKKTYAATSIDGEIINSGTIILNGNQETYGLDNDSGNVTNDSEATLSLTDNQKTYGLSTNSGNVENLGELSLNNNKEAYALFSVSGEVTNSGEVTLNGNTSYAQGIYTQSGDAQNSNILSLSGNKEATAVSVGDGSTFVNKSDGNISIANTKLTAIGIGKTENPDMTTADIEIINENNAKINLKNNKSLTYGILLPTNGKITNQGLMLLADNQGNTYGISATSGEINNAANAQINIANTAATAEVYGIAVDTETASNTSVKNAGTISIVSNSSNTYGIYNSNTSATIDNSGLININGLLSSVGYAYGINTKGASGRIAKAQNTGNITMANNARKAYGMFGANRFTQLINGANASNPNTNTNTKIEIIGNNGSAYGMYGYDVVNYANIVVNNNGDAGEDADISHFYTYGIAAADSDYAENTYSPTNRGVITLSANKGVAAYGMYSNIQNANLINGDSSAANTYTKIEMTGNRGLSYGMRGYNMTNYATITISGNGKDGNEVDEIYYRAYGMFVPEGSNQSTTVRAVNAGNINLSSNLGTQNYGMFSNAPNTQLVNGISGGNNSSVKIEMTGNKGASYGMRGYDLSNYGNITITGNKGDAQAMLTYGTAQNTGTIRMSSNNTAAGMYGAVENTVLSNGLADANNASTYIEMAGNKEITYGMFGYDMNNYANIVITGADNTAYGMYAQNGTLDKKTNVLNAGSISLSGNGSLYGIYAAGANVIVTNTGTISINGTSCTGDACNDIETYPNAIVLNGATLQQMGTMSAMSLDLSSFGGNVLASESSRFEVTNALSGDLLLSSDVVKGGFDDTYAVTDMIDAGDVSGLNLLSQSALFDAKLENESDAVLKMKDFNTVVENSSVADFLKQNYASGNNEELFNLLKKQENISALNNAVDALTGADVFNRFNFEDMTMMRELNMDVNNVLFNDSADHLTTSGTIAPFYFDSDSGSDGKYALYNTRIGRHSYGLTMAFTNVNSSDRKNDNYRSDESFQMSVPFGYKTHGFKFITAPRFGYAYGTYDRNGYDGRVYEGTVEKRMFGLMNEMRYPIDMDGWSLAPAAEFNLLGYHIKGHEQKSPFALNIRGQDNYSVEAGLGLYANKDMKIGKQQRLKMYAGMAVYHEFADPYTTELNMQGMSGSFRVRDARRKDNRAVLRGGFDYGFAEDFSLIGTLATFIDGTTHTNANVELRYHF